MSLSTTTTARVAPGLPAGRDVWDWLFALLLVGTGAYAWQLLHLHMDVYEKAILVGAVPCLIALGWFWSPLRGLSLGVGALVLLGVIAHYL